MNIDNFAVSSQSIADIIGFSKNYEFRYRCFNYLKVESCSAVQSEIESKLRRLMNGCSFGSQYLPVSTVREMGLNEESKSLSSRTSQHKSSVDHFVDNDPPAACEGANEELQSKNGCVLPEKDLQTLHAIKSSLKPVHRARQTDRDLSKNSPTEEKNMSESSLAISFSESLVTMDTTTNIFESSTSPFNPNNSMIPNRPPYEIDSYLMKPLDDLEKFNLNSNDNSSSLSLPNQQQEQSKSKQFVWHNNSLLTKPVELIEADVSRTSLNSSLNSVLSTDNQSLNPTPIPYLSTSTKGEGQEIVASNSICENDDYFWSEDTVGSIEEHNNSQGVNKDEQPDFIWSQNIGSPPSSTSDDNCNYSNADQHNLNSTDDMEENITQVDDDNTASSQDWQDDFIWS